MYYQPTAFEIGESEDNQNSDITNEINPCLTNNEFKLYPNPVSENLNIVIPEIFGTENSAVIKIYNIPGKEVKVLNLSADRQDINNNNTSIDIHELDKGVYEIIIINGEMIIRSKFIKN